MVEIEEFGTRVARLRKRSKISQTQLGEKLGTSQAWASRLEGQESPPVDGKVLSNLAKVLDVSVVELLEGFETPPAFRGDQAEMFFCFCANPFCDENTLLRAKDGGSRIRWSSGEAHSADSFEEINFCESCGNELVKECPSCSRRLRKAGTKHCTACGTKVNERPTAGEWKMIDEMLPAYEEPPDDDIPF